MCWADTSTLTAAACACSVCRKPGTCPGRLRAAVLATPLVAGVASLSHLGPCHPHPGRRTHHQSRQAPAAIIPTWQCCSLLFHIIHGGHVSCHMRSDTGNASPTPVGSAVVLLLPLHLCLHLACGIGCYNVYQLGYILFLPQTHACLIHALVHSYRTVAGQLHHSSARAACEAVVHVGRQGYCEA